MKETTTTSVHKYTPVLPGSRIIHQHRWLSPRSDMELFQRCQPSFSLPTVSAPMSVHQYSTYRLITLTHITRKALKHFRLNSANICCLVAAAVLPPRLARDHALEEDIPRHCARSYAGTRTSAPQRQCMRQWAGSGRLLASGHTQLMGCPWSKETIYNENFHPHIDDSLAFHFGFGGGVCLISG